MPPLTTFEVPRAWGPAYSKMARRIPYLTDYSTVPVAATLVSSFVCPAMTEVSNSKTWNPEALNWEGSARGPHVARGPENPAFAQVRGMRNQNYDI